MSQQRTAGLGTNQEAVRRHNLGTLLRHVHGAGQLSRAELTTAMGLNRSTIAGLVAELGVLGVTRRAVPASSRTGAGRPSAGVSLAHDGPYVIAVDLGVDRAVVAAVALGGDVLRRAQAPVDDGGEAWQVGAAVAGLIRQVVTDVPASSPLVGIGISVPGLVRRGDGLIRMAPNLEWTDVSFGGIVLAALGLDIPVSLANDANLGALAEHRRGAGVGIDDLIYISGNVGVGAGVIVGGVQLEGVGGYAGEMGHISFNPNGLPCHCGNIGCWETEVGAYAIADAISSPESGAIQLGEVLEAFAEAPAALRPAGTALGYGLANIVNAFNPQMVVLGGHLGSLYTLVRAQVDAGLAARALPAALESVTVCLPGLGADSVLLGAAEIAFEPLFVDPVAALSGALVDVGSRLAG
ncbi:MAG: ROK family protein [Nocardioides sp.]